MAYKVFSNGDALTGSELNTYLMNQSVMVFASTTARDAALTAPTEGMVVWLQDANKYVYYTGSAWTELIDPTLIAAYAPKGNAIINGAFDIWQRGTTLGPYSSATTYVADRWYSYLGATPYTYSRQSTGYTGLQYCLRAQRTSGNSGTSTSVLVTALETVNSIPFAGQGVTLSFYARAGANYSAASGALNYVLKSGTGTDQKHDAYTGGVDVINQTATLTTSWQRFSYSATVGVSATELAVIFSTTPTGTAGANDYFEITGVQLEIGSVATAFKRNGSNIQGELAACQRYYEKSYEIGTAPATSTTTGMLNVTANSEGNSNALVYLRFTTTKRTAPTMTMFTQTGTSGQWQYLRSGVSATNGSALADYTTSSSTRIYLGYGATWTSGEVRGHWVADAEL